MSRTTTIPKSAQVLVYSCAAATLGVNAFLIERGKIGHLVPALVLGAIAVAFQMRRQRLSTNTEVSLSDIPLIFAILTLSPGMAMLVGTMVGVVPRGRLGNVSRAVNIWAWALPAGVAAYLFALLRDGLGAVSPSSGAAGWFVSALAAVAVHIALHAVVMDIWVRSAYGYPSWQWLREAALPVAKYDLMSGSLVLTLVETGLLLDGWTRLLPLIVACVAVAGLGLFLGVTRKQLESQELKDEFFRAIFVSLARLLEMKDPDTAQHSARVAMFSRDLAGSEPR